jgi:hypothetical protein
MAILDGLQGFSWGGLGSILAQLVQRQPGSCGLDMHRLCAIIFRRPRAGAVPDLLGMDADRYPHRGRLQESLRGDPRAYPGICALEDDGQHQASGSNSTCFTSCPASASTSAPASSTVTTVTTSTHTASGTWSSHGTR